MIRIYFYTLEIAFFSTVIAAAIGIVMAYFTAQRNFWGRKIILGASVVPLCVPPLLIALGYVGFWGMNGTANRILAQLFNTERKSFLYSLFGIIIAQGFYNFPLVTGIVTDAWESLPKENENAARLLGAGDFRVLWTITLPRLKGAIASACIPVFLYCFFSFMIVLLFSPPGYSTLEVEIYHSIRSTLDVKTGAGLAIMETLTALFIVFAYSFIIRKNQKKSDGVSYTPYYRKKITKVCVAEKIVFIVIMVAVLLFFFFPLLSILGSSFSKVKNGRSVFSFEQYAEIFASVAFWKALGGSVVVGVCASGICCVLAFLYAIGGKLGGREESAFYVTLPLVPMAVSSVVLAWCFGLIFHRGNIFLLVIMQTLLYWPLAYRQIQNGMNRINKETDCAAKLLSKNKVDSILRVYIPACKNVIISAFGYCFAVSIGDATLPLVLSIPKFNTLALYTYRLAATYRFNQACSAGILMIFVCLWCKRKKSVI